MTIKEARTRNPFQHKPMVGRRMAPRQSDYGMNILFVICVLSTVLGVTRAFLVEPRCLSPIFMTTRSPSTRSSSSSGRRAVDFESLMDMDVVIYSPKNTDNGNDRYVGAVQEDGKIAPLSAWSLDPAFGDSIELLVDEEDRPGFPNDQIIVHSIIPEESLSYGSRQVGGGKGLGNPHGEESELLYYVDQELLNDINVKLNPDLEILW